MALKVPVNNPNVTQPFGANPAYYAQFGQKGHNGIDYGQNAGTVVYASEAGTIHFEGWGQNNLWLGQVAGISVLIDHGTFYTGYAHLQKTIVSKGQKVTKGQVIGYVGATGTATGPHLHFEVLPKPVNINNGYYGRTNPAPYFKENDMVTQDVAEIITRTINGRDLVDSDKKLIGKVTAQAYLQTMLKNKSAQNALEAAKKPHDFTNFIVKRYRSSNAAYVQGLKDTIKKLEAETGIDQATKDTINQTNENVTWIRSLLDRIFR